MQEDPSLNGTTKDEVRRRFKKWVNLKAEIPNGFDDFKRQFLMRENPRYNYCIHVDSDAMESVTPQPPVLGGDEDDYDEGEPEIEGSNLYDVGWMMVDVTSLVPARYSTLIKNPLWDGLYRSRPPKMNCAIDRTNGCHARAHRSSAISIAGVLGDALCIPSASVRD